MTKEEIQDKIINYNTIKNIEGVIVAQSDGEISIIGLLDVLADIYKRIEATQRQIMMAPIQPIKNPNQLNVKELLEEYAGMCHRFPYSKTRMEEIIKLIESNLK